MLDTNSTIIKTEKGKEFTDFLRNHAKTNSFWDDVKRKAATPIDRKEIDALFVKEEKR